MNTAPCPSPALRTPMLPPCSSIRFLQIARPRPRPECPRCAALSACQKWLKTNGSCASAMPAPVSATSMRTRDSARVSVTCTWPPRGVNFSALDSRFHTTCCTRAASALTTPASLSSASARPMCLACAAGSALSSAACTSGASWIGRGWMRILPLTMRDTSIRSSIRLACSSALRSIVSSARSRVAGGGLPVRATRTQPVMALNGERSSCETTARNSSLAAVAASATLRASTSAASSSLRRHSVISVQWFSGCSPSPVTRNALTIAGTSWPAASRSSR